jgi:hypothetical protein
VEPLIALVFEPLITLKRDDYTEKPYTGTVFDPRNQSNQCFSGSEHIAPDAERVYACGWNVPVCRGISGLRG